MDSSGSTWNQGDRPGYTRRPHSLIEQRLGSQAGTVEKLLPFDRYLSWALRILNEIPRTNEMDVTRNWLEFIYKNRHLPVMYDFVRLFVFSLHLRYRVKPFDRNPKEAFLKQERFDVVNAGRVLISRLVALEQKMNADGELAIHIQRRDRHYSKSPKPIYGKTSEPQRFFPLVHISNNRERNTKEYFATQGIPGFGRHCWYTFSDDKYPFYYDQSRQPRSRKDILGRLADHITHMERRKQRPITEHDLERFRLTTRDWWNWRDERFPFASEEIDPEDQNFQWYKHSNILKGVNFKLDKKHIKKIMEDEYKEVTMGYQPIPKCVLRNILGLDLDDSTYSNVRVPCRHRPRKHRSHSLNASSGRPSISKWLDDLDVSMSEGFPETSDQHFSPAPSGVRPSFLTQSPSERITSPSRSPRRIIKSCIRRSSQSPRRDENQPSPFMNKPIPPFAERSSQSPRMGRSPSPRAGRSTPSPCAGRSTPSPCAGRSTPPYAGRSTPPCAGRSTPPNASRASPSVEWGTAPVFDTSSNIYREDAAFAREVAERIGDPTGPPEMVNAAIGGWLNELESSLHDVSPVRGQTRPSKSPTRQRSSGFGGASNQFSSPVDAEEGFFGSPEPWCEEQIEGDTLPEVFETGRDFADEMKDFESQAYSGWSGRHDSSLEFETAQELSFVDQFLLPTADVQFDEATQDAVDPFGGYDEPDDDWVAPPEIVPYGVSLPQDSETGDRRAGQLFLPPPKRVDGAPTPVLERISWPDQTHLYDINTDFPETDRPFDFLEETQFRNIDDMPGICEGIPEEEDKWLNLADVAEQIGKK